MKQSTLGVTSTIAKKQLYMPVAHTLGPRMLWAQEMRTWYAENNGESVSYDGSRDLSFWSICVCVMDVFYICVGAVLVIIGVRIFIMNLLGMNFIFVDV